MRPIFLLTAGLMVLRRSWSHAPLVGAALTTWPVALLSAGMVPWYATQRPPGTMPTARWPGEARA